LACFVCVLISVANRNETIPDASARVRLVEQCEGLVSGTGYNERAERSANGHRGLVEDVSPVDGGRFGPMFNVLLKLKKKIFPNEDVVNHAVPSLKEDWDKAA
jgi:hypothetical protein